MKVANPINGILKYTLIIGLFSTAFGLSHLYGFSENQELIKLYDAIFNTTFGVLFLISTKLLQLKKTASMYLIALAIGLSLVYSAVMNRGLNIVILTTGSCLLYLLFRLKKKNILK